MERGGGFGYANNLKLVVAEGLEYGALYFEKAKLLEYLGTENTDSINIQRNLVNRVQAENDCFYSVRICRHLDCFIEIQDYEFIE